MIEAEVGVEIRQYCTVRVTVEDPDDACQMAEKLALEGHSDVSWNDPEISYSEILGEYPVDPQDVLSDVLYEEYRDRIPA